MREPSSDRRIEMAIISFPQKRLCELFYHSFHFTFFRLLFSQLTNVKMRQSHFNTQENVHCKASSSGSSVLSHFNWIFRWQAKWNGKSFACDEWIGQLNLIRHRMANKRQLWRLDGQQKAKNQMRRMKRTNRRRTMSWRNFAKSNTIAEVGQRNWHLILKFNKKNRKFLCQRIFQLNSSERRSACVVCARAGDVRLMRALISTLSHISQCYWISFVFCSNVSSVDFRLVPPENDRGKKNHFDDDMTERRACRYKESTRSG